MDVGADKVTVNTAFVENPKLIDEFARKFGSSTIIASIQAKRNIDGTVTCYTHNGRNNSKLDVYEWAHEVVERGVGEVLVTSVDRDGTGKGYDIGLISKLTKQLSVPVIACGGAGRIEDVFEASKHADAVSFGSILHYGLVGSLDETGCADPSTDSFKIVENFKRQGNIVSCRLEELKDYFQEKTKSALPQTLGHD